MSLCAALICGGPSRRGSRMKPTRPFPRSSSSARPLRHPPRPLAMSVLSPRRSRRSGRPQACLHRRPSTQSRERLYRRHSPLRTRLRHRHSPLQTRLYRRRPLHPSLRRRPLASPSAIPTRQSLRRLSLLKSPLPVKRPRRTRR